MPELHSYLSANPATRPVWLVAPNGTVYPNPDPEPAANIGTGSSD